MVEFFVFLGLLGLLLLIQSNETLYLMGSIGLVAFIFSLIVKNIIVDKVINSFSFEILKVEIKKEKDEEIFFGSVNDSINNKADPIEINSKSPLNIFIKSMPKN